MKWRQDEIQNILTHARTIAREHGLTIKVSPALPKQPGRLIVIIPKRIGSAPVRNRCKRRLRELFYALFLPNHPSTSMVVIVKRSCHTTPFQELRMLFESLPMPK